MTLDPRTRVALVVWVGAWALLLDRVPGLLLLAGLAGVGLLRSPVGWRWRWRALGAAALVVWSTVLSQGLFYGDHPRVPLLELGPVVWWREGVVHGLVQSLRLVATGFAGTALAVSTPPDRLYGALVSLRVPHTLSFLSVTALRTVPEAAGELWTVRAARSRRGRPLWPRGPWDLLRQELAMMRPVAARAVRRARALADSLDARGFDPERPRRSRQPLRMSWPEVVMLGLAAATWVAAAVASLLYRAYLADLLYFPALRPLYGWVRAWL